MPIRGGVLREVGFRRLWWANLAGGLGGQFATLALSVTAVLALHATPWQLGLITALGYGAHLVLGLPIGVWVDRWQKKRILVAADLVRAAAVGSVPVAYLTGTLTVLQVMAVAAVVGVADVFFETAHTSVLPVLVTRDRVSEANARLQTSDSTMAVVGPGLAGLAVRVVTGPVLYAATAALHLVSAAFVGSMPVDEPPLHRHLREPFRASLRTGLAFVVGHPVLRTFLLSNAAVNLGAGVFMAVLPIYVLRDLGLHPATYGFVVSVGAVGGIVASLTAVPLQRRVGEIRTKVLCACAAPLAFAAMPLAALAPDPAVLVGAAEFLFGSIVTTGSIAASGARARVTPHRLLGRVAAASRFVTLGAVPIGALAAGALTSHTGATAGLWLAVALAVLGAAACVCSPLRTMRDLPTALEAPDELAVPA